ncbi:UDP-glucose 4-epimerase GalE [Stappia sp.]|uniref:UDP-glucose 4-epimerase GalE n=1 Tax=Stappia sp. TaxID=1870903 RepID=UPI0032D91288
MAILVTGGAGYIGSHMVWRLLDAGETVVVVDNLSTGHDWAVPAQATLVEGDIGDPATLARAFGQVGIEAVIHFAGSVVVPESLADPLKYYRNNTCASRALIEACVARNVTSLIFSSTAAVYGEPEACPVAEDAPKRPVSPYGTSKLMTELMLADVARASGLRYAALRYFNVAGADPQGRTGQSTQGATHLLKVACEAALGKRDGLTVFGTDYPTRDGTAERDYIHVSDLVEAHFLALKRLRDTRENFTVNCGYGRGYSVLEVVQAVQAAAGSPFPVHHGGRRAGDPPQVIADNAAIVKLLDWEPHHMDLERIARDALAWERHLQTRNSRLV